MSIVKHSPGPWKLCTNEQDQAFHIIGADSLPVASPNTILSNDRAEWSNKKVSPKALWESVANERERANAKLIAAAPDLLCVLKELEDSCAYWSEYDVPVGIAHRIRAAISKATN
jgi:hypothetical protein